MMWNAKAESYTIQTYKKCHRTNLSANFFPNLQLLIEFNRVSQGKKDIVKFFIKYPNASPESKPSLNNIIISPKPADNFEGHDNPTALFAIHMHPINFADTKKKNI